MAKANQQPKPKKLTKGALIQTILDMMAVAEMRSNPARCRNLYCLAPIVYVLCGGLTACRCQEVGRGSLAKDDTRDLQSLQATHPVPDLAVSGPICTLRECSDNLTVEFSPPIAKRGKYSVELLAGDRSIICPMQIPQASVGTSCPFSMRQEPSGQLGGIYWEASSPPSRVQIQVSRNGSLLRSVDWKPSYVTIRPNGPECPPECHEAVFTLDLPE
jgi:hypothetical protein